MKKQEMRAAARKYIISVLSFARNMNRGYTAETWTSDRACRRARLRETEIHRSGGAIMCMFAVGLITAASAQRCIRLGRAYLIDSEAAHADEAACFKQRQEER